MKYAKNPMPEYVKVAGIIRYCQHPWEHAVGSCKTEYELNGAMMSGIVHIADTVSTLIRPEERILCQRDRICDYIQSRSGKEFCPQAVEAFLENRNLEVAWLDIAYHPEYLHYFIGDIAEISLEETARLTRLMSRVIDYRSSFTAMHSAGVSAAAVCLDNLANMSEDDCIQMEIAGYLHDLGKIMVPRDILEKPGKLTDEEFYIINEHPYWTRSILLDVKGFDKIANWAGYHHEKLNGRGYPFHFGADMLDPDIVALLVDNYELVNCARDEKSKEEGKRYFNLLGR